MKRTLKFKPENQYCINNNVTITDIVKAYETGETVTGIVVYYNPSKKTVTVDLGNNIFGTMSWDEVTIYEFSYPKIEVVRDVPRQILSILYKKIRCKIIDLDISKNHIFLSRKKNMLEVFLEIRKNFMCIYEGEVISKYKYGNFYDIGDGILAFCHITEYTYTFIKDLGTWTSLGEISKLKLCSISENFKIRCSRKEAVNSEEGYSFYKRSQIVIVRLSEPIYSEGKITGYFAEINPAVMGIADIGDKQCFKTGDVVTAVIKKVEVEKRKIKLNIIV